MLAHVLFVAGNLVVYKFLGVNGVNPDLDMSRIRLRLAGGGHCHTLYFRVFRQTIMAVRVYVNT